MMASKLIDPALFRLKTKLWWCHRAGQSEPTDISQTESENLGFLNSFLFHL